MQRRLMIVLVVIASLYTGIRALEPADVYAAGRTIAAYGDSGVSSNAAGVAALAVNLGSVGYMGLGDYGYSAGPDAWKRQMSALLAGGCLCVRGNHDGHSAYTALYPGGTATWSERVAGVRLIGLDTQRSLWPGSAQWNWLVAALAGAQEPVKVLLMHRHWWLGPEASHPGSEFPGDPAAMERLLAQYGVSLVLAAHEHNYQRSVRAGVTYIVAGTGGRSIDPIRGAAPGTVRTHAGRGALLLTLAETSVSARFHAYPGGAVIDGFTVQASTLSTTVYDDALAGGWRNWSWGGAVNLAASDVVYSGTRSIAFTATSAWAGLYLRASTPVPAGAHTHLRFAARGSQSNQPFAVHLRDENGARFSTVRLSAYGGHPPASAWKVYQIPLADLGATGRRIGGLVVQEYSGQPQPTLYVDAVAFVGSVETAGGVMHGGTRAATHTAVLARVAQPRTRASVRNRS